MEFKVGQRVQALVAMKFADELIAGNEYTVAEVGGYKSLKLEGQQGFWSVSNFKAADCPIAAPPRDDFQRANELALSLANERAQRLQDQLENVKADRDKTKRLVDKMTRERDVSKDQLQGQKGYLEQELNVAKKEIKGYNAERVLLRSRIERSDAELAARAQTIADLHTRVSQAVEDERQFHAMYAKATRAQLIELCDQLELARLERDEARDERDDLDDKLYYARVALRDANL